MQEKLKVALAGAKPDGVAAVHIKTINRLSEMGLVELVAVAEKNQRNLAKARGIWDGRPREYRDYQSMLNSQDIDIVTIATPHHLHLPMARAALEKGINVFCEKPPAVLVQRANKFLELERKSDKKIAINCMYTASLTARDLVGKLQDGIIGPIKAVVGVGKWCRTNEYYTGRPWAGNVKFGEEYVLDGALFNQFPHLFRQCLLFAGSGNLQAEKVYAELYRAHDPAITGMEDTACLKTKVNGVDILLYCTNCFEQDEPLQIKIVGSEGTAYWNADIFDNNRRKNTSYKIIHHDGRPEWEVKAQGEDWESMCFSLYSNFVDLVKGKTTTNYSPLAEAALHVKIINGAYISSASSGSCIQQISRPYWEADEGVVTASGTGLKDEKSQTKILIKDISKIIDTAADRQVMFSQIPSVKWAKASQQVDIGDLKMFKPTQYL